MKFTKQAEELLCQVSFFSEIYNRTSSLKRLFKKIITKKANIIILNLSEEN